MPRSAAAGRMGSEHPSWLAAAALETLSAHARKHAISAIPLNIHLVTNPAESPAWQQFLPIQYSYHSL